MDMPSMPAEPGFRRRGKDVTRLETFVDAAFAFSLSLLVIVHDDLPASMAEFRDALRRIPTFALCFVLLAMFWAAHNRWSRRFGLEDLRSTLLSLAFVLVVLVYVYPLRMVIASGLWIATGGWVPSELGALGDDWLLDLQTLFMVYSIGFGLLSWLLWLLNAHARDCADALGLDARERFEVAGELGQHRIGALVALASVLLSLAVLAFPPDSVWLVGLPMWAHAALGVLTPWYHGRLSKRRKARFGAGADADAGSGAHAHAVPAGGGNSVLAGGTSGTGGGGGQS